MLTDHIGQIVLKNGIALNASRSLFTDAEFSALLSLIEVCHIVGRIAFPIFCFLLTEGFVHTRRPGIYLRNLMVSTAAGNFSPGRLRNRSNSTIKRMP